MTAAPAKYPIAIVHWEDATNVAEWTDIDEAIAFDKFSFDYRCTNVGYLRSIYVRREEDD